MSTYQRRSGVTVDVPDDITIADVPTVEPIRRGRRGPLPRGPVSVTGGPPASPAADPVVDAMIAQDLDLVDSFDVSTPPGPTRRGPGGPSRLDLDVDPAEDAVILLEQDGVYSWRYPLKTETVVPAVPTRGPLRTPARRKITFDLSMEPVPGGTERTRRGPASDFAFGIVRTYVFRFVARVGLKPAIGFLERKVRTSLVNVLGTDPLRWASVESLDEIVLPSDRAARILLLVPGTFSTTLGSFGALGSTEWGRTFLDRAGKHYDAVIGYDHRTLSLDPRQNAEDLLARLERSPAPGLEIDAVAYSRGGLVLRSLVEYLLPSAGFSARVRRAVFVGCTNDGTRLASPEHWKKLIDLTTNLVTLGTRAMASFGTAALAASIVKGSIETMGALVKFLAAESLTNDGIPGLAAMTPGGRFVTDINETQPGQPMAADAMYYAITSDFDVDLVARGGGAPEFPVRLARWILDAFADALLGEPNDLVVHTASMTAIDIESGSFVKEKFEFGKNPHVYHTIYFTRPEVVSAMSRWLNLEGTALRPGIPAGADSRIVVVPADQTVDEAIEVIRGSWPTFLIAERREAWGGRYRYAFRSEEVLAIGREMGAEADNRTLQQAVLGTPLEMHERTSTPETTFLGVEAVHLNDSITGQRLIIMDEGVPMAVMDRGIALPSSSDISGMSHRATRSLPRAHRSRGASRGRGGAASSVESPMDSSGPAVPPPDPDLDRLAVERAGGVAANGGHAAAPPSTAASRGTVYVAGDMPSAIPLGVTVALNVAISHDEITIAAGPTAATAPVSVALDRKLLVQVIPKRNVQVVNDDRAEIALDSPRIDLVFDVQGTTVGPGEVWVLVRQGPMALATLKLMPEISPAGIPASSSRARDVVDAEPTAGAVKTFPILQIFEQQNGAQITYHFILQPGEGVYISGRSAPLQVSRTEYVAALYKEIENRWLSTEGDYDNFLEEMRSYGATLLDELVPREVQAALWEVRDSLEAIQVVAEEPFIPWELVHLKEPRAADGQPVPLPAESHFLAQKGLVRWLHGRGGAPLSMRIRRGSSHYVIPDYPVAEYALPEAQAEIPLLQRLFGAKVVDPDVGAIRSLLRTPGAIDHFHFSGHGEADVDGSVAGRLMLGGTMESGGWVARYLVADLIKQSKLKHNDGSKPLVMLNACQVGRANWRLTSIGGFAEAFLSAGAGAFVGTLWSVGDTPGRQFSEGFYNALAAGQTLSQAALAGRAAARNANEGTWLAYVVYGYPHATLTVI